MAVITMKQLLEAGVQFGHYTRRWNPKMKEYIYGERNNVYIIDLQKTAELIEVAYAKMVEVVKTTNCKVLFVGTRKQISDIIREEATRAGQFYIDKRWLGGTMTNFKTIRKSIAKMIQYEEMEANGTFDKLPKKEVIQIKKEMVKLHAFFNGIRDMNALPGAIFVVDPKTEHNAILEARKLNIPVFGLVDTNCDPDDVDYIIPANDDGIRAVRLIVGVMANAVLEGNGQAVEPFTLPEEEKHDDEKPQAPKFNKRPKTEGAPDTKKAPRKPAPKAEGTTEAPVKKPAKKAPKAEAPETQGE